jgi:bifunctional enzyme CysN/CysC
LNPLATLYEAAFGPVSRASVTSRPPALRILTCGAVDDGKSTLIGRLLYEAGGLAEDQQTQLQSDSRRYGAAAGQLDFALLTDGLEAERERGITIDVAYRSLSTPQRDFIIADTPGHEQYTANMATGASQCEVAIILVDAIRGVQTQSRRHAAICSALGIGRAVLAVNKMDLAGFAQARFERIVADFAPIAAHLRLEIAPIPISAKGGDNVVGASASMGWYRGPTLLEYLEQVEARPAASLAALRLPVQGVSRGVSGERVYLGSIAAGSLSRGDIVVVAPGGAKARVAALSSSKGPTDHAGEGMAVAVRLEPEIDLGRGDILHSEDDPPLRSRQFAADVIWFDRAPLLAGRDYELRMGTTASPVTITSIRGKLDVETGARLAASEILRDELAVCHLAAPVALAFDLYARCAATGSFLLVDRLSGETVGAGMIRNALDRGSSLVSQKLTVDREAREALLRQTGAVIWFTGLSGAGKSTIADALERRLHARGKLTFLLDGDNVRLGLNRDLGFTDADRVENLRRVTEVARLMVDAGLIVLCSFISPFERDRASIRERLADTRFLEIFVDAPLDLCERRDPKGLYARARRGQLRNFTGIDSVYEPPRSPDLVLDSSADPAEVLADRLLAFLLDRGILR